MKKCCHCRRERPESHFTKKRTRPDGLDDACKLCNRHYRKKTSYNRVMSIIGKEASHRVDVRRRIEDLRDQEESDLL